MTEHLIWWLSQLDCEELRTELREPFRGQLTALPQWLIEEVRSRDGRAGHGRLWEATQFEGVELTVTSGWDTPLGRYISRRCGGIVITREELPLLAVLPGIVTDLELRRIA